MSRNKIKRLHNSYIKDWFGKNRSMEDIRKEFIEKCAIASAEAKLIRLANNEEN